MPIRNDETLDTLTALNIMASYIGIPPLSNLIDLGSEPDFEVAHMVLDDVAKSTLAQGLPCNTDYNYTVDTFDINGHLLLPEGALLCKPDTYERYVERDGKIYDLSAKAFVTTPITATIVWNWTFDDLPMLVKQYITITASRAYVGRTKGDEAAVQLSIPDERRVSKEFQRYAYEMDSISVLDYGTSYLIANAGRTKSLNHYYR